MVRMASPLRYRPRSSLLLLAYLSQGLKAHDLHGLYLSSEGRVSVSRMLEMAAEVEVFTL